MSQWLGFESNVISLGASVEDVKNQWVVSLTSYGWQVVHKSIPILAYIGTGTNISNAFDLDPGTYAGAPDTVPKTYGIQLAAGFTPVKLYVHTWGVASVTCPKTFTLDWSNDGSAWTTQQTWASETNWGSHERRVYAIPGATAHTYWRLSVTAAWSGTTIYIYGIVLEDAAGNRPCAVAYTDFIPPSDQAIGNAQFRDIVRIITSSGACYVQPVQELLQALPPSASINIFTAGAVTLSVTINGATVSFVGSAPNTAAQNGRGLYDAIRASVNANFTAYNWYWNGVTYIEGCLITPAPMNAWTTVNCTYNQKANYCAPQESCNRPSGNIQNLVTIDLINGFVYYLQVNKRGFAIGTKTNVGFYGTVHACYGANADALAQIPATPPSSVGIIPPMSPIELLVGMNSAATTDAQGVASVTHVWGVQQGVTYAQQDSDGSFNAANGPFTRYNQGYVPVDMAQSYSSTNQSYVSGFQGSHIVYAENIYSGSDVAQGWSVHRMGMISSDGFPTCSSSGPSSGRVWVPSLVDLDWYKYIGVLANEQMCLAPHTDYQTPLTSICAVGDTVINVVSTTGFPATGYLCIEGEAIQYIGKTGTSFTGCTRSKYATTAQIHYPNAVAFIGAWFVKINQGLLLGGFQKPT